jgi:DNA-binding MarR family transcriptional regulator
MALRPLTVRQKRVLAFLDEYASGHGFPPTLREIGEALNLSNVNAVRGHVAALEKKGYILRTPDKARSIQIVRHPPSRLSRLKRKLHQWARTNEGALHYLRYGLAVVTWRRAAWFAGARADEMSDLLDREAAEHGWQIDEKRLHPDHIVLVVRTWPTHSPRQTVHRIRAAGDALKRRWRGERPAGRLWAQGFVATTDLEMLDELVARLLAETTPTSQADRPAP